MVNHVDGEGVVGEQPLLRPGQSYDYVSGCPLTTPFGSMEGFYTFERADGSLFEVRIPFFPLSAPETADGRSPR
jgi:ApaG protein